MKKLLSVLFVVAMLVGCMVPYTTAAANTPTGTAITTVAQFEAMTDGDYYLANDLDFSGKEYTGSVVTTFSGNLDGNGKTIKNIKISAISGHAGIFRTLGAAANTTVKNLVVENATVTLGVANELTACVGILAGYQGATPTDSQYDDTACAYTLTLENIAINGTITGMAHSIGGVIGLAKNATLRNCYTYGSIELDHNNVGAYKRYLGGLIGSTRAGVVNVYNSSNSMDLSLLKQGGVKAHASVGGIVGCAGAGEIVVSEVGTEAINIYNCVNFGNLYNEAEGRNHHQVAGIVALKTAKSPNASVISGCVNFGNLQGAYNNAGILGWNAYEGVNVTDCIVYGRQTDSLGDEVIGGGFAAFVGLAGGNTVVSASCVDKRESLPENKKAADHLEVVDVQASAVASNKFSIRAVAGLKEMNTCKKIGFEVTTYVKSGDSFSVKSVANKECKVVFGTLTADSATGVSGTLKAEDIGADALFALTIEGAPAAANNGLFVVVIRPYSVDGNGTTEYGEAVAAAYDAGAFVGVGTAN